MLVKICNFVVDYPQFGIIYRKRYDFAKRYMLRKIFIILCLSLVCFGSAWGETKEDRAARKHEVRVMIGDWLMESVLWRDNPHGNYGGVVAKDPLNPPVFKEDCNYSWLPHFGAEYQYRINRWLGVGMQIDFQRTTWNRVSYNTKNAEVGRTKENFFNLSFLPTVRFTYLHHKYVNLYSSLSAGIDVNGGSEVDFYGRHTVVSPACNFGFFGISANYGPWFGSFELGGMYALKDGQTIYMASCRLLTLSFGYRL